MIVLTWYRFFASVAAGAAIYFLKYPRWWAWLISTVLFRAGWFLIERFIHSRITDALFREQSGEFKKLFGPYGIRIINKAEQDRQVKESLAEVFTRDEAKLKKTLEQLEMMDTLFKAGMRPEGDQFLLHDLKLKFAKHRLEKKEA